MTELVSSFLSNGSGKINHNGGYLANVVKCQQLGHLVRQTSKFLTLLFWKLFPKFEITTELIIFKYVYTCKHACIFNICQLLFYSQPLIIF